MKAPKPHTLNPDLWVDQFADMLFGYCVTRVSDAEKAKDLVQDTFVAALKSVATYKGEMSEKNWLFTILKNKIIDHYRKKSAIPLSHTALGEQHHDPYFDQRDHWQKQASPASWTEEPSDPTEKAEFYQVLAACKEKLPALHNAVFTMKYMEDLNSAEICKVLSISSSNYWVVMHRAKLGLRACLEKNWM